MRRIDGTDSKQKLINWVSLVMIILFILSIFSYLSIFLILQYFAPTHDMQKSITKLKSPFHLPPFIVLSNQFLLHPSKMCGRLELILQFFFSSLSHPFTRSLLLQPCFGASRDWQLRHLPGCLEV